MFSNIDLFSSSEYDTASAFESDFSKPNYDTDNEDDKYSYHFDNSIYVCKIDN